MSIFDEIEADAKAGTQDDWFSITDDQGMSNAGPYVAVHQMSSNRSIAHVLCVDKCGRHFDLPYAANARRIARVPQLERIALAAKELADAAHLTLSLIDQDDLYDKAGWDAISDATTKSLRAFLEASK